MMSDQMVSIPCLPNTSRKTWPIGKGSSLPRMSETDGIANEVAMRSNHPKLAVPTTETMMARGAARAALAVSSEI
jgi:hypothetical protein